MYPIAAVFSELDAAHDLLVDEVAGDAVLRRVVPRREDLLPEEQPPGGVSLLRALLFSVLLALRHGVHHVILTAAQRRHLTNTGRIILFIERLHAFLLGKKRP